MMRERPIVSAPSRKSGRRRGTSLLAVLDQNDTGFAIVTGGERWGPILHEFVGSIGLGNRLAAVGTVAPTGADIARDPRRRRIGQ